MALFFLSMLRQREPEDFGAFPWNIPAIRVLRELKLKTSVTFLIGENGSGKSTLLEAMAIGMRAVAVGSTELDMDATMDGSRELARGYRFERRGVPKARMFLRAEDVFGFSSRIIAQMKEFQKMKDGFRETLADGSRGQFEAMALAEKEKAMLASRYGVDPHARSHGESFLHLLKTRLVPNGLYFLDEPETPLSPTRVLALLVLIHDSVNAGSQFVIATHSPILLAFPFAEILRLDHSNIAVTSYEEVENVRIMRDFLNDPRRYMEKLFRPDFS